jgi:hypothetical protein
MAKLTKAQRDELKKDLPQLGHRSYFLIDGYYITTATVQVGMQVKIAVYVNSLFRGDWLFYGRETDLEQMSEICRKFYCWKLKSIFSAKELKSWEKCYGSKAKAKTAGIYDKQVCSSWVFSSTGAFLAHIQQHNDAIQLITSSCHEAAMAAMRVNPSLNKTLSDNKTCEVLKTSQVLDQEVGHG